MIKGLKSYAEYIDSKIMWAPTIPSTWKTERAKWLFRKMERAVRPEDEVVTCFRDGTVTLRKNRRLRGFTEATAEIGYQGIRKGDLVIHGMDSFAGAVGVSDSDGKGTPVYSVCIAKTDANAYYFAYTVREMARTQWILALSRGIRERSTDFRFETFGRQHLLLPPVVDQEAIVRFLGHVNQKTDNFIRVKRRLIGLLHEQIQTIIQKAVTRGLDPNVKLKPSGVERLGDIPEHWDLLRSKYVFREVDERSKTGREEMLSVSHLTGVTPRSEKNITMFKAESNVGHKICRPGDLAINTMWAWMAALGFSKYEGVISPAYAVYRQREPRKLVDDYGDMLLRTEPYKANYICRSTGIRASRLRLYPEEFLKIPIIIPPKDEQQEIVDFLAKKTAIPTEAIARANREIALMQEYRARLTSDIVTGKLDVRAAAAELPDPADTEQSDLAEEGSVDELIDDLDMEQVDE